MEKNLEKPPRGPRKGRKAKMNKRNGQKIEHGIRETNGTRLRTTEQLPIHMSKDRGRQRGSSNGARRQRHSFGTARSRLYQHRFWQSNTPFAAFFEILQKYMNAMRINKKRYVEVQNKSKFSKLWTHKKSNEDAAKRPQGYENPEGYATPRAHGGGQFAGVG